MATNNLATASSNPGLHPFDEMWVAVGEASAIASICGAGVRAQLATDRDPKAALDRCCSVALALRRHLAPLPAAARAVDEPHMADQLERLNYLADALVDTCMEEEDPLAAPRLCELLHQGLELAMSMSTSMGRLDAQIAKERGRADAPMATA